MSVEAMVHSYAVSYRIPIVIARVPRVLIAGRKEIDPILTNLKVSGNLNFLEVSNAVDGLLKIEKLATSERPAEVYNISSFIHVMKKEPASEDVRMDTTKITSETNWKAQDLGNVGEVTPKNYESIQPVFLIFGADSELKTQFYELAKADGITLKESSISNLQEASDKSVLAEIDLVKPSHLVYFGNETESFEGDCFTLRTNMATNLYFPWLLASIAEKNSLHFTHFGNTSISQESSSLAVKGYTGKMLEYFQNTLRFGPKIDANTLELIKGRKTGGLNNNI
ncbi:hypothetical protein CAEBREN_19366 [Caenorhabditis brenneri]|uniref:Uncharacterized protein n=1 Tax=Caenorhabditis brenneri TaxID=135651 RepID=G0MNT5_CAEBE|nr:hypothetical protein CAEBREN_19366 [Caenorhabditis brenneri]